MSINLGSALTGGIEALLAGGGNPIAGAVGATLGALQGGSSSAGSLDPESLESALSQQTSTYSNVNTLSSLAQSQPQADNLLSSLIDGDDGSGN
jgi:hypothetical protein